MTLFRSIKTKQWLLIIILCFLAITIPLATILNIWLDEAYTLHTTSKNWIFAFKTAIIFEGQPPLYFAILSIWRIFSSEIFFARLYSIICILISIFYIRKISALYLPKINSLYIVLFYTFNPFIIWAAVEIRCYAQVILLSSLLLYYFHKAFLSESLDKKHIVIYVVVSILSVYTQYFTAFILLGNSAILIFAKNWKKLKQYVLLMLVTIVFLLFITVPFIEEQFGAHITGKTESASSILNSFIFIIYRCENYIYSFEIFKSGKIFRLLFGVLIIIAFISIIYQQLKNKILTDFTHGLIIIPLFVTIAAIFALLHNLNLGVMFLMKRHTAVLFIPLIIFVFLILSVLKYQKYIIPIFTIVSLMAYCIVLKKEYTPMVKTRDYKSAVEYIEENENNNEPIFIYTNNIELPFSFYYNGINKLYPLPMPLNLEKNIVDSLNMVKDEEQVAKIFNNLSNKPERFWFVYKGASKHYPIYKETALIKTYFNTEYNVIDKRIFYENLNVEILKKK